MAFCFPAPLDALFSSLTLHPLSFLAPKTAVISNWAPLIYFCRTVISSLYFSPSSVFKSELALRLWFIINLPWLFGTYTERSNPPGLLQVLWAELCAPTPQCRNVEVLTPNILECECIWKQGLERNN